MTRTWARLQRQQDEERRQLEARQKLERQRTWEQARDGRTAKLTRSDLGKPQHALSPPA
jgi:hypothetical protein